MELNNSEVKSMNTLEKFGLISLLCGLALVFMVGIRICGSSIVPIFIIIGMCILLFTDDD